MQASGSSTCSHCICAIRQSRHLSVMGLRGTNDQATSVLHLVHEDGTVAFGAHLHTTPMHVQTIMQLPIHTYSSQFQHESCTKCDLVDLSAFVRCDMPCTKIRSAEE